MAKSPLFTPVLISDLERSFTYNPGKPRFKKLRFVLGLKWKFVILKIANCFNWDYFNISVQCQVSNNFFLVFDLNLR